MLKKTQRGPGKVADITDLAKAQSKQRLQLLHTWTPWKGSPYLSGKKLRKNSISITTSPSLPP